MYKYIIGLMVIILVVFYVNEDKSTTVKMSVMTNAKEDSGTNGKAYVSFNQDEKMYALDLPSHQDRKDGATDTYEFRIDNSIDQIKDITLILKSDDAWRIKEFNIQFIDGDKYSAKYISNKSIWLSTEKRDHRVLGAAPSHTFVLDMQVFNYKKVPTIYLK
ncbi:MAG TPA: hypothetical protein ENK76_02125 [Campylobacterales bacterium]|nr:hypothetical protein [Campylobacterales bacterium]